ncbi:MAG: hypothetical protein ABL893_19625, partial [Hyphomicrobium sp.]
GRWLLVAAGAAVIAAAILNDKRTLPRNEVLFRSAVVWDGKKWVPTDKVYSWHLKLPVSFQMNRFGIDQDIFLGRPKRDIWSLLGAPSHGTFWISIFSDVEPSGEVVPTPYGDAANTKTSVSFSIRVSNDKSEEGYISTGDFCVQEGHQLPGQPKQNYGCNERAVNCAVHTSYRGWRVDVFSSKNGLFQQPEKVCEITRRTLESWTVSIDDRRVPAIEYDKENPK